MDSTEIMGTRYPSVPYCAATYEVLLANYGLQFEEHIHQ